MLQPYGPLEELAPGIWIRDGEWNGTLFRRRMTVCRVCDRDLVIHNAFQLRPEDISELERLGTVRWILVPNRFHSSEAGYLREKFPEARVIASPAARKALKKNGCPVAGWFPEDWKNLDMPAFEVRGTRGLGEWVFLHRPSRSLLVTDLVFHMREGSRPMDRSFLRMNDIDGICAPSRIFKMLFVKNVRELERSLSEILREDFDRLIMNHGEVVRAGAKEILRRGFLRRFPKMKLG